MSNQTDGPARIQVLDSAGNPLPFAKEPFVISWDGSGLVKITGTLLIDLARVDLLANVFQLGQGRSK